MDILTKIVEVHCAEHDPSIKDMCMSLVKVCIDNNSPNASCIGDAGNIRVDMITL